MGSQDSLLGPGTGVEVGMWALTARAVAVPPTMDVAGSELGCAVDGVLPPNRKPPYQKGERKGAALDSTAGVALGTENMLPVPPAELLGTGSAITAAVGPTKGPSGMLLARPNRLAEATAID